MANGNGLKLVRMMHRDMGYGNDEKKGEPSLFKAGSRQAWAAQEDSA